MTLKHLIQSGEERIRLLFTPVRPLPRCSHGVKVSPVASGRVVSPLSRLESWETRALVHSQSSKRRRCHFSTLRADESSHELQLDRATTLNLSLPFANLSRPRLFRDSSLHPADGASPCQSNNNSNRQFSRPSSVPSGTKAEERPFISRSHLVRRRSSGLSVAAGRRRISDVGGGPQMLACC